MSSRMLCVAPHEDELLSAYLARLAHAHGLSPTRFCAFHFAGVAVWTRDIDRSASSALVGAIAAATGMTPSRVAAMTLRGLEQQLALRPARAARATGLGAIGLYHRRRSAFGLRYCAACLAAGGAFVRAWRIEALMWCPLHRTALWDACTRCGAALELHHQRRQLGVCHACHCVLGAGTRPLALSSAAQRWQRRVRSALATNTVPGFGAPVRAADWLAGVRLMQRVCGPRPSRGLQGDVHARARLRVEMAEWTAAQLTRWPLTFARTCRMQRITQRRVVRDTVPAWLAPVIAEWPVGTPRPRPAASSVPAWMHRLALLQARHAPGWRSKRAELLLHRGLHA